MGANFTAYQAFLRRMLQNDSYEWETDCEVVRAKVTAIANSLFDARKDGSATVVSSTVDGSSFTYRIDGRFDQDSLVEHATRALGSIERINPKDLISQWATLTPTQQATYNRRAIQALRKTLHRRRNSISDFRAIPL